MSGRSAIVRRQKVPQSEKDPRNPYDRSYPPIQIIGGIQQRDSDLDSTFHSHNGHSSDLNSSIYDYGHASQFYPQQRMSPHIYKASLPQKQARPIVIASAIERSDLRTHIDGITEHVRFKLGRLVGMGGGSNNAVTNSTPKRKPEDMIMRRPDFLAATPLQSPPPVTAVPSLIHSASTDHTGQSAHLRPGYPRSGSRQQGSLNNIHQPPKIVHPEVQMFSGNNKARDPWKMIPNVPENLSTSADTLVLLYAPSQNTRPLASFYINSQALHEAGANLFIDLLEERPPQMRGHRASMSFQSRDDEAVSETMSNNGARQPSSGGTPSVYPPLSDYNVDMSQFHDGNSRNGRNGNGNSNIKYELYIDCPDEGPGSDCSAWLLTTRNFLAVIHDFDSICGVTLFDALSKVVTRVLDNPGYLDEGMDRRAWIVDYLKRHNYEDVRNNPAYAVSMLAFSELPQIRWKEAFIESFLHCTGMRPLGVLSVPEWQFVSPCTQILIYNGSTDIGRRIRRVQSYLQNFDFAEIWPARIPLKSCGRLAYERLRTWLTRYILGRDPTIQQAMVADDLWLTPPRIQLFKDVFHSLYNYLVDRDIIFDGTEYQPGAKWSIISKSGQHIRPDISPELPMTEMLSGFDDAKGYPHIPSPYPLLPPSIPLAKAKLMNKRSMPHLEDNHLETKGTSYSEASNLYNLGNEAKLDRVITDFTNFERNDEIRLIDPRDARLGRWVLIYGALQVLATIETNTPGVRFTQGVRYCLSIPMRGVVPWAEAGSPPEPEPRHELSHAFIARSNWPNTVPKARATAHKAIVWGEFGDGRKRAETLTESSVAALNASSNSSERAESLVNDQPGLISTQSTLINGQSTENLSTAPQSPTQPHIRRSVSSADKSGAMVRQGGRGGLNGGSDEDSVARAQREADKARLRRAQAYGFSNYKPEAGW